IDEIDSKYLEYLTPGTENRYKPLLDPDLFDEVDRSKLRLKKPVSGTPPRSPSEKQLQKLRKLKPVSSAAKKDFDPRDSNLFEGAVVEHIRFGKGKILKIEGAGA